jgi:hypothetical protein
LKYFSLRFYPLIPLNCAKSQNYNGFDIVIGPGDPAEDLFSLAACDYIMGPSSTFTIWASFYGDVPLFMIKDPLIALCLDGFSVCT